MAPRPPSDRQLRLFESAKRSTAGRRRPLPSTSTTTKRLGSTGPRLATSKPRSPSTTASSATRRGSSPSAFDDEDSFSSLKRDNRQIRRSQLLHRIATAATEAGQSRAALKNARRRARARGRADILGKMDGLAAALPAGTGEGEWEDVDDDSDGDGENGDSAAADPNDIAEQPAVPRKKPISLIDKVTPEERRAYSSRPGVLRRRARVFRAERDVFERTLAALGKVSEEPTAAAALVAANEDKARKAGVLAPAQLGPKQTGAAPSKWEILRSTINAMRAG